MKRILVCIGTFLVTLVVLWAALFAASCIPNELIYDNMYSSSIYYSDKKAFVYDGAMRRTADNYADSILLNVAWNMNSDDPFVSCLDTKYYDGEDYGENWGLYCAITGKNEPNTDYTRYWHGMTLFVRLFTLFTDVNGIKTIGVVTAFVLLGLNCALLLKKRQFFAAGALALSFICVHLWNIRLSMEYQPAFLVTLAVLPFFIIFEHCGDGALSVLAVISGVLIAFFDFLTDETLTILIPLAIVFIIRKQDEHFGSFRQGFITTAKCGSAWLLSYAGTFLAKWGLASIVTGEDKFATALSSAEIRMIGEAEELSPVQQIFFAPLSNISTLFGGESRLDPLCVLAGIFLSAAVLGAIFYLFRDKSRFDGGFSLVMLIIALLPLARYLVLNNHSYLHTFFTYRALASTILAVFAIVWFTLNFRPQKKKSTKKGRSR